MRFFSRVILPLILFAYVGLETYLKIQQSSICTTTGCNLAEELLRFNSVYLNYFGMAGAIAIAFLGFLSLSSEGAKKLFYIALYSAIAFEAIMIGYQMAANPEPCSFCMGVYGLLLLIALMSNWRYLLYALPAIIAMFVSISALAIPKNQAIIASDGIYLVHSSNCSHCDNVKSYFAKEQIEYNALSIKDVSTRVLLKHLNIGQIPVLLIREKNKTEILKGDHSILEYYKSKGTEPTQTSSSIDIYSSQDDGCDASVFKESNCEEPIPKY